MGRAVGCNIHCGCCPDLLLIWKGWPSTGPYGYELTTFSDLNGAHPWTNGEIGPVFGDGRRFRPVTPGVYNEWIDYTCGVGWRVHVLTGLHHWTFKPTSKVLCGLDSVSTFAFDEVVLLDGSTAPPVDASNVTIAIQWCVSLATCDCLCAPEVTLSNLDALPATWRTSLESDSSIHVLDGERGFDNKPFVSDGLEGTCSYSKSLPVVRFENQAGNFTFEPSSSELLMSLAIDWATGDTILTISSRRHVLLKSSNFSGGPTVAYFHVAEFQARFAGAAPDACNESATASDLNEEFVDQTTPPDCMADVGNWKKTSILDTRWSWPSNWPHDTDKWPQSAYAPIGSEAFDGKGDDGPPCFPFPPTAAPVDFSWTERDSEWLYKDLIGVDFSGIDASMRWVNCDGS